MSNEIKFKEKLKHISNHFFTLLLILWSSVLPTTIGGVHGIANVSSLGFEESSLQFGEPRSKPKLLKMNADPARPGIPGKIASAVGGVLFMQTAQPDSGVAITKLTLQYDSMVADGGRVRARINGKQFVMPAADWIIFPTASYVESGLNSCFTLFGKLEDTTEMREIHDQGGKILNYHPAFENTLLGLRLMQMDILLLHAPYTGMLPKDESGKQILGLGEYSVDRNQAIDAGEAIKPLVSSIRNYYRSYVVTDRQAFVSFKCTSDTLRLSGDMGYWFWKYRWNPVGGESVLNMQSNNTFALIQFNANQRVNLLIQLLGQDSIGKAMLKDTLKAYVASHRLDIPEGHIKDKNLLLIENVSEKQVDNVINKLTYEEQLSLLHSLFTAADWTEIESLTNLNKIFFNNRKVLRQLNPAVWDASEKTMRTAAFFRYVKLKWPNEWNRFLASIQGKKTTPAVNTPHILRMP